MAHPPPSGSTGGAANPAVSVGLARLNRLSMADATGALRPCCPSDNWAASLASQRPYADVSALLRQAGRVLQDLEPDSLRAALCRYPTIGAEFSGTDRASAWSRSEETGLAQSSAAAQHRLQAEAQRYRQRFGWTFVTAAAGRGHGEILEELTARLTRDPVAELEAARAQVGLICQGRLLRLLAALAEEP